MSFLTMPPEINSLMMYSGAGAAPMLEAAAAWAGLATELNTAASAFGAVTSGLAEQAWQGPAAQAMAAAAAPYAAYLSTAAAHADTAALQARSVADVFEAARAAVVHPLAIEANRNGFVRLVMSNFFGQNAPAIATAESVYEEMWAADVDAMVGYHAGASAAAEQMVTFGPIRLPRGTFVKPFVQAMKRLAKTTDKLRKNTEKLRDIAEREISEEMQQRQRELNELREKFRYPGYSNPFGSWGR